MRIAQTWSSEDDTVSVPSKRTLIASAARLMHPQLHHSSASMRHTEGSCIIANSRADRQLPDVPKTHPTKMKAISICCHSINYARSSMA